MKMRDAFDLASRNLRESVLRNSLTTVGIAVGVASLVAMLSLGAGLQALANRRLTRSGLFNTVFVFQQTERGFGGRGREQRRAGEAAQPTTPPVEAPPLDENARARLQQISNVSEVYPDIRFNGEVRWNDKSQLTNIGAFPPSARENDAFETLKGSYFSGPAAEEAILRRAFALDLTTAPESLIGQSITLRYAERVPAKPGETEEAAEAGSIGFGFSVVPRQRPLKVVGIVDQEPLGGIGRGSSDVLIPTVLAQSMHAAQPAGLREIAGGRNAAQEHYTSLVVRVNNPNAVQKVEDSIKQMGYGTFSLLDATKSLRRFFAILDLFLLIFGSVALAVACLGIVNTLVMAILERRREIGIMKAIGASDSDVRSLFFVEAASMGAAGGALGVALGWLLGGIINIGTAIYLQRQQQVAETIMTVPWWLVGLAIGIAVVVSLGAGLYPASRAAKLDPVQALRYS